MNFDSLHIEKRNLNVILSIGRKVPRYPECFVPQWWKEIPSDNIKEQELLEYLKQTVNELKGFNSIKIWQEFYFSLLPVIFLTFTNFKGAVYLFN